MVNIQQILPDIYWAGASDRRLSRFENLFPLPNGVSYNCYVVIDDRTALMDTADNGVNNQFMENVMHCLNGRKLDYLVMHHMEPDHCSQIQNILDVFPDVTIVGNATTFKMLDQFYVTPVEYKRELIKEGDVLDTGHHRFVHYMTPMVHWPEVFMSFDEATGALFSADASVPSARWMPASMPTRAILKRSISTTPDAITQTSSASTVTRRRRR